MRRTPRFTLTLVLLATLALPAAAAASPPTGGAEAPDGGDNRSKVAVASEGGFTLAVREDALLGRRATFRGDVGEREAGRTVTVERYDDATATWAPAATATVAPDGTFVARWKTDRIGQLRMRATLGGGSARAAAASPELAVKVYRPGMSSWYGPGFYGRRTACGQKMTRTLQGVAHKKLPCGTRVALLYRGRTVTVPVVDRGPFHKGRRWDLTAATARTLGFTGTDRVGALRVAPGQPAR